MTQVTARRGLTARPGPGRVRLLAAAVAMVAVSVTGCSGGGSGPGASRGDPGSLSARLVASPQALALAGGSSPAAVTERVAGDLFASAPVVVVARAGDGPGVARGAGSARAMGVPLLLVDHLSAPGLAATVEQITRLHPGRVLATGTGVADALREHLRVPVVTDPRDLPQVTPAQPAASQAVIIHERGLSGATRRAVSASARAAGATVVPVRGGDLRTNPDAIKALAAASPVRVIAAGPGFPPAGTLAARVAAAGTGVQLPGGGQKLFPARRLVALYGHPGTPDLGVLGDQDQAASIARAKKMAGAYQKLSSVPVIPTFEIIATVAAAVPGPDGDYSTESTIASLRPWVTAAGRAGMYVVLDLQAGRANLLDQARRYAPLLRLPYVGLALDPEWKLTRTQVPLQQIGSIDATQINQVSAWLSDLTARNRLPQKLLVIHQFQLRMIGHEQDLDLGHDNIQLLLHMGRAPNP